MTLYWHGIMEGEQNLTISGSEKFYYPAELIPHITASWNSNDQFDSDTPLPNEKWLRQFTEVAYQASLLTEEQRRIGFRLAFISPDKAEQLAGPIELGRLYEPIHFNARREFKVAEILRLAPATDHTKVLICVSPFADENGDENLMIWGILNTGASWFEYTKRESKTGVPPPDCITVSSIEPGNLTISRRGVVLISLKRGNVIVPTSQTLYEGPLAEMLNKSIKALYSEVCQKIGDESYGMMGLSDNTPGQAYFSFIERLLFHIREHLHGGALILVPDNLADNPAQLDSSIRIKYPCNHDQVWNLISDALALRHSHNSMFLEIYKDAKALAISKYHELSSLQSRREGIENRITDYVQMISSASAVDGAVVLTDHLRLLGFGGEITVLTPDLHLVHLATDSSGNDTYPVSIESYGTRHRSAFRFCWANEGAIAFVISQDGGVKGVKRVDDKLIFWPDINFGPVGI